MSGRKARIARAHANHNATRQKLWKQGEEQLVKEMTPFQRLLYRISPKRREKGLSLVGDWYKRALKSWATEYSDQTRNRDVRAMRAARRKMDRAEMLKRYKAAMKGAV